MTAMREREKMDRCSPDQYQNRIGTNPVGTYYQPQSPIAHKVVLAPNPILHKIPLAQNFCHISVIITLAQNPVFHNSRQIKICSLQNPLLKIPLVQNPVRDTFCGVPNL